MPHNDVDFSGFEPQNPNTSVSKTHPDYLPPDDTVRLIQYYYERTTRNTFYIALKSDDITAINNQIDPYAIKKTQVRDRDTYIIFEKKPIGVEFRIYPNSDDLIDSINLDDIKSTIDTNLPFTTDINITAHKSQQDVITVNIRFIESANHLDYPTYFMDQDIIKEIRNTSTFATIGDIINGSVPLIDIIENAFETFNVEIEHNEMFKGSLGYKTRESGLKRPWG